MAKHITGTREEWLAARLQLLEAEKELTRRSDEVAQRRQQLPWVRIDKEYRFETEEGSASLTDLFLGRSQLLVYHFMFGYGARLTDERRGCTGRARVPPGMVAAPGRVRHPLSQVVGVLDATGDGRNLTIGWSRSDRPSAPSSASRRALHRL